jgi:parvulin-like peptidyl-prolyl isomerase
MKRTISFALLLSIVAVFGFSQNDLQTVATVNLIRTESITLGQLKTETANMEKATGRSFNKDERLQVLDAMINERLVLQAAERDRINVTDNEINQHLNELKGMLSQSMGRPPTDAELAMAIKNEYGVEMQVYKDQYRKQSIAQKYMMFKKENLINSIKIPTDIEIINEYNLLKGQLVRPETVRFTVIQVPYGPDAASRSKAKETADRLAREIGSNPQKFDEVVTRSVAPNSGYMAGDAGYMPRSQDARNMVGQDFMNTAFSLRQGQVSTLIESPQGFNIIKVTEKYEQKNLELDDIYQPGTRITVKDFIGQQMLEMRQQEVIVKASEELISELRAGRSFQIMENNLTNL